MTDTSAGKTKTKDPRGGWRAGKKYKGAPGDRKGYGDSTNRAIRRQAKAECREASTT